MEPAKPKKRNKRYTKVARKVRPKEEWIELPDATPAIISEELFQAAQKQLRKNFEKSPRNRKSEYLLSGHIRCGLCGQRFNGYRSPNHRSVTLRYHCAGKNRTVAIQPCPSRSVAAREIEDLVWAQVKEVLLKPELLIAELRRRQEARVEAKHFQEELELNQRRLETLDQAETRSLRLHLYSGMSEEKLMRELERIKGERERIEEENAKLRKRLEEVKQAELDEAAIMQFCERARRNIEAFAFEEKRQALDALDIRVIVNPDGIAIKGAIPAVASAPPQ